MSSKRLLSKPAPPDGDDQDNSTICLKTMILQQIQSEFKNVIHQIIQPLHTKIETLSRNNNALVTSNNELVNTISTMQKAALASTARLERLETVSKLLDHRVQRTETVQTAIEKQLQNDRGDIQKLLLSHQQLTKSTGCRATREQASKVPNTAMRVKGTGDSIGARQRLHIAITRVPLDASIDGAFLQKSINARFAKIGAKIEDISLLLSNKYTNPPKTKSFKLTIDYPGNPLDIYNGSFYPAHVKVARFNFPSRHRNKPARSA